MNDFLGNSELEEIAREAEAERQAALATTGMEAAELGYYEAELESLRNAACSLRQPHVSD